MASGGSSHEVTDWLIRENFHLERGDCFVLMGNSDGTESLQSMDVDDLRSLAVTPKEIWLSPADFRLWAAALRKMGAAVPDHH